MQSMSSSGSRRNQAEMQPKPDKHPSPTVNVGRLDSDNVEQFHFLAFTCPWLKYIGHKMSIIRLPFTLSIIWAVHMTMTPPQPPPRPEECTKPIGLEVSLMPPVFKVCFWTAGLVESLLMLASEYPSQTWSRYATTLLVHTQSNPQNIHLTWGFFIAWAFAIFGALLRRRCYQIMGEMFTFELSIRRHHKLVTTGPYAFVRHPSYTGALLAMFGAMMCHATSGSWAIECSGLLPPSWARSIILFCWIASSVAGYLVVAPRLEEEDQMLHRHFGSEWEDWAKNVTYRLVPGVY